VIQFVLCFRELGSSVFLYTGGNEVTAVVIYDFAQEAQFTLVAAFSVVVVAVNLGVVSLARRWLAFDRWAA
jgi:iron(III) transport system permease protein